MRASGLPSECTSLLGSLMGARIVSATRYSVRPAAQEQLRRAATADAVFSLASGLAAIEFDTHLILALASEPSLRSIRVWVERNELGVVVASKPCASDPALYSICATDPVYSNSFWRDVINARVRAISILVHEPATAKARALPNEAGLCFCLDTGAQFVAAHGLHNDSADFALIPEAWIAAEIRPRLSKRGLYGSPVH